MVFPCYSCFFEPGFARRVRAAVTLASQRQVSQRRKHMRSLLSFAVAACLACRRCRVGALSDHCAIACLRRCTSLVRLLLLLLLLSTRRLLQLPSWRAPLSCRRRRRVSHCALAQQQARTSGHRSSSEEHAPWTRGERERGAPS